MPDDARIEADRQLILDAQEKGGLAKYGTYVKLSGPGWMQSALTLGGGSLGGSLYLGILAGVSMMWLQPFAMILGVVMLSAISYVTLSTGERPFRAINRHINPVLGWSWLLASLMANMVWSFPQYSLCFAVIEQNLLPDVFTGEGPLAVADGTEASTFAKWLVSLSILLLCTVVTWSYGSGSLGVKIYEAVLKIIVAVIVLCFFGVVIRMSLVGDGIDWSGVRDGLIPKWRHLFEPSDKIKPLLAAISDLAAREYWSEKIISVQRDVMLGAVGAAVGINMTFLLPYNLLSSGWNKDFRGLSIFDMSTGMFIPFIIATGCIVIASATQFHGKLPVGIAVEQSQLIMPDHLKGQYQSILDARIKAAKVDGSMLPDSLTLAEKKLAATALVKRDAGDLANSFQQLFAGPNKGSGRFFSNIIFGLGVVGMTLSSISLMMLISGFVICEIVNVPPKGWIFRIGCLASAIGVFWMYVWTGDARAFLTVAASVFGAMLLPIAYITFYCMMNQRSLMGGRSPKGQQKIFLEYSHGDCIPRSLGGRNISDLQKRRNWRNCFHSSLFCTSRGRSSTTQAKPDHADVTEIGQHVAACLLSSLGLSVVCRTIGQRRVVCGSVSRGLCHCLARTARSQSGGSGNHRRESQRYRRPAGALALDVCGVGAPARRAVRRVRTARQRRRLLQPGQ